MKNDFETLLEFLVQCGPEVTGRGHPAPTNEVAERLERFAVGECDDSDRAELCALLQLHPAWLRWVADRVKMARAVDRRTGPRGSTAESSSGQAELA